MFGLENEDELPDPAIHLNDFIKAVDDRLRSERKQWNPMKKVRPDCIKSLKVHMPYHFVLWLKKMTPWINTKYLKRSLSEHKCVLL